MIEKERHKKRTSALRPSCVICVRGANIPRHHLSVYENESKHAKKAKTMLPDVALSRDVSVASSRTRRVFTLGDGDDSDGDGEGEGSGEGSHDSSDKAEEPRSTVDDDAKPPESARGMKRYHALLELLATEVGYLLDLRALVSVSTAYTPSICARIVLSCAA